jgi:hypothetical protein
MIIIINKNLLRVILTLIIVFLLGRILYWHMIHIGGISSHLQMLCQRINEPERASTPTFLVLSNINCNIEIFDINKGSVIKEIQVNDFAIAEGEKFLQGITGMYVKVNAFPDSGYIIKVPFKPNIKVENQWLNGNNIKYVDKFFVIFPQKGVPYLLVLDEKERPYFYYFNGDLEKLLKYLDFKPDILQ